MKTKIKYLLLLTLVACGLASCSNDLDPWADGNHRYMKKKSPNKVYTMKLSLGGDFITEYDEPLRSGETPEGDTYVGINIYRTKKESGATEEKYGYGVYKFDVKSETGRFDKENSSIQVDLLSDYSYRFEATVLTEWTDKLAIKNASEKGYSFPFLTKSQNNSGDGSEFLLGKIGSFYYTYDLKAENGDLLPDNERSYLPYLKSGKTYTNHGGDWSYSSSAGHFYYPRIKRYYGVLDGYDPEEMSTDGSTVDASINLAYQCFGVKIIVVGLPAKTNLKVRDKRQPKTVNDYKNDQDYLLFPKNLVFEHSANLTPDQISDEELSYENLYSLKYLWTPEEMNDDSRDKKVKFTLEFSWDRGLGDIRTFESGEIEVNPKMLKTIRVNVSGAANDQTKGNIKFDFSEIDENLVDGGSVDVEYVQPGWTAN